MTDSNCSIHAVLFDFGGVLAEEGFRTGLFSIARLNGLNPEVVYRQGINAIYGSGYVMGKANETDFWRAMRSHFSLHEDDTELTDIILAHFKIRPGMIDLVRNLRVHGLTCAILSDQTDWLDRLDQRDGFYQEFDRVYCSYHMGRSKRDAAIFDEVVANLGMRPVEVLFLDDDSNNVERARIRGLKVLQCDVTTECREGLQKILGPEIHWHI